uniref:Uncharacterized protein n=1 Tax=Cacopsylla melanoneura TaxID=428564 RepID=A0A8D9A3D5_9HEMI
MRPQRFSLNSSSLFLLLSSYFLSCSLNSSLHFSSSPSISCRVRSIPLHLSWQPRTSMPPSDADARPPSPDKEADRETVKPPRRRKYRPPTRNAPHRRAYTNYSESSDSLSSSSQVIST